MLQERLEALEERADSLRAERREIEVEPNEFRAITTERESAPRRPAEAE